MYSTRRRGVCGLTLLLLLLVAPFRAQFDCPANESLTRESNTQFQFFFPPLPPVFLPLASLRLCAMRQFLF